MKRVPAAPDTLLSIEQAALWAGWEPSVIAEAIAAGELLHEAARIGGRDEVRVRFVDLEALVRSREQGQAESTSPSGPEVGVEPAPVDPVEPLDGRDAAAGRLPHASARGAVSEPSDPPSRTAADGEAGEQHAFALQSQLEALVARLEESEQERRAQSAALLLTNRRLLELASPLEKQLPSKWSQWGGWAAGAGLSLVLVLALHQQTERWTNEVARLSAGHQLQVESLAVDLVEERKRAEVELASLEQRTQEDLAAAQARAQGELRALREEHADERAALLAIQAEERSAWQERLDEQEGRRREENAALEDAQRARIQALRSELEGRLDDAAHRASSAAEALAAVQTELGRQEERAASSAETNALLREELQGARRRLEGLERSEAELRAEVAEGAARQGELEARGEELELRLAAAQLRGASPVGEAWGLGIAREIALRLLRIR